MHHRIALVQQMIMMMVISIVHNYLCLSYVSSNSISTTNDYDDGDINCAELPCVCRMYHQISIDTTNGPGGAELVQVKEVGAPSLLWRANRHKSTMQT